MKQSTIFEVYEQQKGRRRVLYTKSLVKGQVYGEMIAREGQEEFREWDPSKSKLCAAILNGATNIFLRKSDFVLYLGSATGTTVSHVSDIVGKEGMIFAVDVAPIVMRDLVFLAEKRANIAPILADANLPEKYLGRLSLVDILYQDVAQKNQVEIFLKNVKAFLKKGGYALFAVKARSIDVSKRPGEVFRQVYNELEKNGIKIVDKRNLDPYQRDHMMLMCKY
ncbi:MAG TPA: fibrillarin-like rRNA/tRNA 2'-O-methyltransferase [Candidatus Nanoarchaeia archaeon]|nr:fibrillarin-like rRNA/tRNA 2'-O-methyltransferase [Candidatus Nanoarchaeia archaeon]